MSALDIAPQAGRVPSLAVRARDVLVSEWTKVRSVRSSYWILLIAAVTAIGGSVIVAIATASSGHSPMDPLASIFLAWLEYPVLAVGILGVLAFTSEYSTGQIRTTLQRCRNAEPCSPLRPPPSGCSHSVLVSCSRSSPSSSARRSCPAITVASHYAAHLPDVCLYRWPVRPQADLALLFRKCRRPEEWRAPSPWKASPSAT